MPWVKDTAFAVKTRYDAMAITLLCYCLAACVSTAQGTFRNDWETGSPEDVGLNSTDLVQIFDFVRQREIPVHSVQIVREGKLVLDAYFYPYDSKMRHDVASVTKSITSTLIGLAIQKGVIRDVQQPLLSFFPNRSVANRDARKQKLTLEHLLTMQAGWDCGTQLNDPAINVDPRLAEMRRSADWIQTALDLPMVAEPGTRFAYCNANCHLLSAIVSKTTGTNVLGFVRRELFEPLGIRDVAWPTDPHGHNHGWGDLQLHPRDMARLGQLFLQRGRWGDRQLISEQWLGEATRIRVEQTGGNDRYGYLWWIPGENYPGVFEAVGRGGQRITVWPAQQLVIVFTGGGFETGDVVKFILKAMKSDGPLPANGEAATRLQKEIVAATKAPLAQPVAKPPAMAARVSGKTFKVSANNFGVSTLRLRFDDSAEAQAELLWNGQRVPVRIGLDSVERFSPNPLVNLPQAAKGEWVGENTFVLRLDLVGAINFYRLKLTFPDDGKKVVVELNERTGLNNEQFSGEASN